MERERGGWGRRTAPFGFGAGGLFPTFFGFAHPFAAERGTLFPSFFGGGGFHSDPFFTRPGFDGSLLGFGRQLRAPAPTPTPALPSGVVIEEIDGSDDEEREMIKRPRRDSGLISHVVDVGADRGSQQTQSMRSYSNVNGITSQAQSFSFQSSSVTYDGVNGAYYTSTTRRIGGDGVIFEESKEADSTSGRASHRISRAINDCGHSVSRKLDRGGRVDTMQTLHNLNEDELDGFERAWEGKAKKYLSGMEELNMNHIGGGQSRSRQKDRGPRRLALPSTDQLQKNERDIRWTNLEGRAGSDNMKDMKS